MTFHKQSFTKRMETGGDPAENAFRDYAARNKINAEHYGFDRSKLKGFGKLPHFVKITPDFACTNGKDGFLVECKGVGRFDHVKIKESDIEGLSDWEEMSEGKLFVFVFDSHLNKVCFMPFMTLREIVVNNSLEMGSFHDNPSPYYKVPKTLLTWEDVENA